MVHNGLNPYSRAESQVLRLMSIYALADKSYVVEVPHLRAALEVWRYCFDSAEYLFSGVAGDPVANQLKHALIKAGPDGLTRTQIIHDVFERNRTAPVIEAGLRVLEEAGYARSEKDTSGATKPTERWFYTEPTAWENDFNDLSPPEEVPTGDKSYKSSLSDTEVL